MTLSANFYAGVFAFCLGGIILGAAAAHFKVRKRKKWRLPFALTLLFLMICAAWSHTRRATAQWDECQFSGVVLAKHQTQNHQKWKFSILDPLGRQHEIWDMYDTMEAIEVGMSVKKNPGQKFPVVETGK